MLPLLFGSLFVCLFLSVPIAISLAVSTLIVFFIIYPSQPMVINLAQAMLTSADSFPLMAIPFFMLVGTLMEKTGIARKLVEVAEVLTGAMPGGLGMAAVVASIFFAAISGSGPATAAAIGGIMLPAMAQQGYKKSYSVSLIGGASTIGPVIPPSIPMIMYGVTIGVSVTKMFTAGFVPGIMMGASLMIYNYVISKKRGYKGEEQTLNGTEKFQVILKAIPAILMPVIVLGGIYGGIFTPTESAVIGVVYTLIVGVVIYKELSYDSLKDAIIDAGVTSATIMILFGPATTFGRLLTLGHIPQLITASMTSLTNNGIIIMLLVQIALILSGMFIDTISSIVLLAPLFVPLLKSYGYDEIYIGVIMVVNLCIGMITPPMGANLYIAMRIGNVTLEDALKEAFPIMVVLFASLLLMILFPPLVTFLPSLVS